MRACVRACVSACVRVCVCVCAIFFSFSFLICALRNNYIFVFQFFSPDLGRCASLYEIPTQYGGYYLNCTQLADGLHPDHMTSRPNLYFRCQNGQLTNIDICPVGTFFESASSQCVAYGKKLFQT